MLGVTTSAIAGAECFIIIYAMTQYGFFHLLDYMVYPPLVFLIGESV